MSYLLLGAVRRLSAMRGYRVAVMMPRPEDDRKYRTLPAAEEADGALNFWEPQLQLASTVARGNGVRPVDDGTSSAPVKNTFHAARQTLIQRL
ncbi:hypothetical protein [Streptomyces profundus]|uniref:hypothetical protein n=1 Tax=Streptomyces profundus TaxID=2867410 RepID=UPI001D164781|nr:hypothetical protein [Streptomyces sp. MA3_2.13]UED85276.1 hypothetical protein K4G22_14625 [Streptomyces sp. MA3_2.13]